MVIQNSKNRPATILLITAGVCLTFLAPAQVATQNLFRRMQFIEYLRLRNQSSAQMPAMVNGRTTYVNTPSQGQVVTFNIKCKVAAPVYKLWLTAETQFAFSKWLDAGSLYAALIKSDSSFCDAYFRLSQCYVARNNLAEAYQILVLAKKRFPEDPLLNLGFGQLYILLSFPRTALYYFEKQLILHPEDPEGFLGASWAASELNQNKEAILYLKKGQELLTNQIITATGRPTGTSGTYYAKNPLASTLDYLYIFESLLYRKLNQNEKSLEAINHLTSADQREISSFKEYCLGMYYYNKGEKYYPKARRGIQKAAASGIYVDAGILRQLGIRSDPTDFKAMVLRENYSKVSTTLRSAKSRLSVKADTLFQNRRFVAAAEVYAGCVQADSTNLAALDRLGECYRELGMQEDAVAIYQLANRKFPGEMKFALLLARELMRAGQTEESILAYRRAINLDKKNLKAYYGGCLALAHKGEYEKALDLWISGKDFLPEYRHEGNFIEGVLFYELGYYDFARPALSNPSLKKDPISKYYLALSYHFLKDHEDLAASNMLDAIKLGAIVSSETVQMVGLDPAIHSTF